jgi:hypothetical protein
VAVEADVAVAAAGLEDDASVVVCATPLFRLAATIIPMIAKKVR